MKYLPIILVSAFFINLTNLNAQNSIGFGLENGADRVSLSFKSESNLMIVPIKINDQGPFNFILDTGSESGMIFDKLIIGENNLVNARTIPIYAADGNKVTDLWVANDIRINFAGVHGKDQSMLVLQSNFVDIENVLGIKAHGILGSEIFNRFVVDIDYSERRINLTHPEDFKRPRSYKKIPIMIDNFRPYVNVDVKQKGEKSITVKLLIDTGASSALFLDAESNEDIVLPERTLEHTIGRGLAGIVKGKIGRVKKVKLGKYKFKKVLTSYPDNWGLSKPNVETKREDIRYGTIGSDVLSKFHVIFNYHEGYMYLKPNRNFEERFQFNTIGMNVMAFGERLNEYFVNDIIPDSPADRAGLEIGDEVIAMNNNPAFFYKLDEVVSVLKRAPGERLKLIIRRDGNLMEFNLKHKRLL
ncbi:aspartyl protease family protein [uncultured Roseivirga sp.]|uniref:aspartyl protease family protein n=1 Tax=uncultured Roseivirga sp. TaxID=543088 RepID=UPI0030DCADD0|tara:strand:- start:3788 stop:5032 length:1245 start_codon:yes stop_codon:yes gene_type:complete